MHVLQVERLRLGPAFNRRFECPMLPDDARPGEVRSACGYVDKLDTAGPRVGPVRPPHAAHRRLGAIR